MLEIIVVAILIAVFAGMIIPRLTGGESRRAEREAGELARLLSAAAGRSSLAGQAVSIEFDESDGRVRVLVLQRVQTSRGVESEWAADPLLRAVQLETLQLRQVAVDGSALSPTRWRIELPAGEPRGAVWILAGLRSDPAGTNWQIELMPEDAGATVRPGTAPPRSALTGGLPIDLDATNQGERAW